MLFIETFKREKKRALIHTLLEIVMIQFKSLISLIPGNFTSLIRNEESCYRLCHFKDSIEEISNH